MLQNQELNILFSHHDKIAFTVSEVAEMLNIPMATIRKQIKTNNLDVIKVGRHYRITKLALYDFLSRSLCLTPLV